MTSIKDVAELANVSVKTVSRILSGYDGVSEKTRQKVKQAMQQLDYYPSAAAQALRGEQTEIISLITDNLTTTPDSYEIVAGIQDACTKHGQHLLIGEMAGCAKNFDRLVEDFRRHRSTAIIVATVFHRQIELAEKYSRSPLILVNCYQSTTLHPTLIPDDEQGGFDATQHLIRRGHRRIAMLRLYPEMTASALRLDGYRRAMQLHQLPIDEQYIRLGVSYPPADELEELPQTLAQLMALPNPPTAIICGNDKMAMRVYMILRGTMGYRIPEDISIVGYDNYKLICENLLPKLSTVSLPYFKMGHIATEIALSKDKKPMIHKISGDFVDRSSVLDL